MSKHTVEKAPNGDPILIKDGWRASFILSPFTKGTFILAAQAPDKRMLFGLLPETGFLIEVKRKPNVAQIRAFLDDCMAGKIVDKTLDAIARVATTS